jgi:ParB family transcriptional regulator, chromosome partitioning protein
MPDPIDLIPTAAIAERALARDRAATDPVAAAELRDSILTDGLRMPIEVFALAEPLDGRPWGLISGFRRLAAVRELADWGVPGHDTIAAFVRAPASITAAMTAMVEENAIRAEVSPWEQALIAVTAWRRELFDTVDAAIDTLYKTFSPDKRYRMRAVAHLALELDGHLTGAHTLSQRQLLRLAAATSRGYGELMRHALENSKNREPDHQWRLLLPILAECEDASIPDPRPEAGQRDRPRRTYELPRHRIRIRRERTQDGWCLHFTGKDAQDGTLIDRVFDEIEFLFRPV